MNKSPFLNAFLAVGYIAVLVFSISIFAQPDQGEDSILIPIIMLSLFVLSAAIMGYLFLYEPLVLWFDGKRQEAVKYFLTTVATFAGITGVLYLALLFVS